MTKEIKQINELLKGVDDKEVIQLRSPIKVKGIFKNSDIHFITLRKPVVRDVVDLDWNKGQKAMVTLASRLSGYGEEVFLAMDVPDWNKILFKISNYMNPQNGSQS